MTGAAGLALLGVLLSLDRDEGASAACSVITGRCAGDRPMSPYRLRISLVVMSELLLKREESLRMD